MLQTLCRISLVPRDEGPLLHQPGDQAEPEPGGQGHPITKSYVTLREMASSSPNGGWKEIDLNSLFRDGGQAQSWELSLPSKGPPSFS